MKTFRKNALEWAVLCLSVLTMVTISLTLKDINDRELQANKQITKVMSDLAMQD